MWVSDVSLRDFRNHAETTLTLSRGVSVFVGPNGQGKTNLVEALGYLSSLSSHRVSSDKALVREGQSSATVRARVHHQERSVDMALEINYSGANRAKLGGQNAPVGELVGWLKVVLFTPEDLSIVRGEPALRRRYLDDALVMLRPRMHQVLADYDKVLRQRNALLKSARSLSTHQLQEMMAGWNDSLVSLSCEITVERLAVISRLRPALATAYSVIAPGHELTIDLESDVEITADRKSLSQAYYGELQRREKEEVDRGMTLVGPHRDDLSVKLNGLPSRTHSSHGEAWSIALSLRMALAEVYRDDSHSGDPVMVLDDVFAELDASRRKTLQELVSGYEQVLVTAAVREDIPSDFAEHFFVVHQGVVNPE